MSELALIDRKGKPVIPARSIETQKLIDRLKETPIGGVVTYPELCSVAGVDVGTKGDKRHFLVTARKRLHRDCSIVFVPVPGVGLQRADDSAKVDQSGHQLRKSRRASGRAVAYAVAVDDFNALPNEKKIEQNANISAAKIIKHFTGEHGMKKLAGAVEKAQDSLPLVKAIEAFRNS